MLSDFSEIKWQEKSASLNKKRTSNYDEYEDDTTSTNLTKRKSAKKIKSISNNITALSVVPLDAKDDDKTPGSDLIFSRENHVYFYTDINNKSILLLQKEVYNVANKIVTKSKELESLECVIKYPAIVLHINSPGGSIFSAFNFIDYMSQTRKKYGVSFHSIVEGRAASAATLISVTCDKKSITEYGYMLIHQLWSGTHGKYNEIKDDVSNLDSLMNRIKDIYKKHSRIPESQLDEILKHDLYWDAKTCKKYKLVDNIL
jgi:ATP-dependent Clp endopeptidase proteolytic subunit ClpP